MKVQGLCFRCEHRAQHLDSKEAHQPRYECGEIKSSVCGCYMYQPVKPVVTSMLKGERKCLRFGPAMLSARELGVKVAEDIMLKIHKGTRGEAFLYWSPK